MANGKAALIIEIGTRIYVSTPYNPGFVSMLKTAVPAQYRKWDPEDRVWEMDIAFEQEMINLCERYFKTVEVERA